MWFATRAALSAMVGGLKPDRHPPLLDDFRTGELDRRCRGKLQFPVSTGGRAEAGAEAAAEMRHAAEAQSGRQTRQPSCFQGIAERGLDREQPAFLHVAHDATTVGKQPIQRCPRDFELQRQPVGR